MVGAASAVAVGAAGAPLVYRGVKALANDGAAQLQNVGQPWSYQKLGNRERFEIRPGDHWNHEDHKERSECALRRYMDRGRDIWQSFALLIEPSGPSQVEWRLFGQWHGVHDPWSDDVSPPIAQALFGETFRIWTASDSGWRQSASRWPAQITRFEQPNFARNVWRHFVYRFRLDIHGKGLLQVWLDGEKIVDLAEIAIGYSTIFGPYFKYGVYRPSGDADSLAAQYANMEIGYESLASRISAPLPIT